MITDANVPVSQTETRLDGEQLRTEYLADVFAYASRRLAGKEDAEDATAETFQAALTHLHRLKTNDPRLWLFGIARRKVADIQRRNRRRREVSLSVEVAQPEGTQLETKEAQGVIRKILLDLPGDQREAMMLHYLEDLGQREISTVMGKSPAAINSLLQRARARVFREGKSYFEPSEGTR
jgi:RNA polymerase sigma factor (sigma-70 family)